MTSRNIQEYFDLKHLKNLRVFLVIPFFIAIGINGIVNSVGKVHFEVHTKHTECICYSDLIESINCYSKRVNHTAEYFGLDIYIKPGVALNGLYVRIENTTSVRN